MNKKGNILDWFYILAFLFVIGVTIIVSYMLVSKVIDSNVFADTPEADDAIKSARNTLLSFDNLMLFIIVGLSIFVLVSSAVVYNHPSFFIIGLILLFIAVTVAGVVSNTFWKFTSNAQISAVSALYPKMTFLMENLPFYVLFMGIAATVVMYVSYQKQ